MGFGISFPKPENFPNDVAAARPGRARQCHQSTGGDRARVRAASKGEANLDDEEENLFLVESSSIPGEALSMISITS